MQGEEADKGSQFIFSNSGNGDGIGSTNFNPSQGQPSQQGANYPPAYSHVAYPPQQQTYAYPQLGVGGYPSSQGAYPPSQQLHGYIQFGVGGYYGSNPPVQGHSHGRAHKVLETLAGGAAAGAAAAAVVCRLVREHHGHYGKHGHGHRRKHAWSQPWHV